MTEPVHTPELILSLSRDQVSVRLLENPVKGVGAWQSTYPVDGLYLEAEIARVLDRALADNPSLFEEFNCVHLLVMDRPNLLLPAYLKSQQKIAHVASRYLRVRAGDALSLDEASPAELVCYSLPKNTIHTVREYFNDIANVHLISLLWKEIQHTAILEKQTGISAWYCLTGKNLLVLAIENGRLYFSKIINIHHQEDVQYYIIACNRLLRPVKKYNVQLQEEKADFVILYSPHVTFDQHITLPSIPIMLQRHFPCAS